MAEIEIKGLRELKSALRELEGKVPKELSAGFKAIAADVADKVRGQVAGKFQKTVKAGGTQKGGTIKYTSLTTTGPWNTAKNITGWWDFGGHVGRGKGWTRQAFEKGRFLYPTIGREKKNSIKAIDKLISDLAKRAGFDEQKGSLDGG